MFAFRRAFGNAVANGVGFEIVYKSITALTIVVVFVGCIRYWKQSPLLLAFIPYIVLITMTGSIIWEGVHGYMKAASAIIAVGILLMRFTSSDLLRFSLAGCLVIGVHFYSWAVDGRVSVPVAFEVAQPPVQRYLTTPPLGKGVSLQQRRCQIACKAIQKADIFDVHPDLRKRLRIYSVAATNTGSERWVPSEIGPNCVCLGVIVRDPQGNPVYEGRQWLANEVPPGKVARFKIAIPIPKTDQYEVAIQMFQESQGWFEDYEDHVAFRETVKRY
jgi:hypothetical protein